VEKRFGTNKMNELTGYELSRNWFDFCFENPEIIRPTHTALYFFAIEHCNRLGWKEKFGFPTQMAMDAIGIKNWRTYSAAFEDIVKWGFFEVKERSKNQYSATVIAIVKNTKANTNALTKAMQKHLKKQDSSIAVINKQRNKEPLTINSFLLNRSEFYPFEEFWQDYNKKVGKDKVQSKWKTISTSDRRKIKEHLPKYKTSQPDKQFRKNPETYLNQKAWNDEVINKSSMTTNETIPNIRRKATDLVQC
jgi:hypothetical protein